MTAEKGIRITFLGCGSSSGVPGVGIGWGKCNPDNQKNQRLRQSIVVEMQGKRFLIDTSPDLRQQLLRAGFDSVDAVIYTHAHADHMNGIDDLRGINKFIKRSLPIYADATTHGHIRQCFGYTLKPLPEGEKIFVRPVLDMTEFVPGDDIEVSGVTIGSFEQDHGYSKTVGFQFSSFVYSTDVKSLTEDVLQRLEDARLDLWVIGTFRRDVHWTHAHIDLALQWIDRVKPKRAILTHLSPDLDYDDVMRSTPDHVVCAFDGMTVEIDAPGGGVRISD